MTMRSDLYIFTYNLDIVSYNLNEMNHRVSILGSEMVQVKDITQHLEYDVKNLRIVSYTTLVCGIAGTIGSAASIGMQLFHIWYQNVIKYYIQLFQTCV